MGATTTQSGLASSARRGWPGCTVCVAAGDGWEACGAGGTKPWLRGEKPAAGAPNAAALLPSGGAAVEAPDTNPWKGGWPAEG